LAVAELGDVAGGDDGEAGFEVFSVKFGVAVGLVVAGGGDDAGEL